MLADVDIVDADSSKLAMSGRATTRSTSQNRTGVLHRADLDLDLDLGV